MSTDPLAALADRIAALPPDRRRLIAVVGPPGAGKSTLAEALLAALTARGAEAAILPMDGFHYDDAILKARGLRPRKGAPETFDAAGLAHLLDRLRANAETEIAVPVFDRALEISRNAARMIPQGVGTVIVEGNYLLLDRPVWRGLRDRFDLTVALDVDEAELRRRLTERWRRHGVPEAEIPARVEANDLTNGRAVLAESLPADVTIPYQDTPAKD